jgi:hypothetical protein
LAMCALQFASQLEQKQWKPLMERKTIDRLSKIKYWSLSLNNYVLHITKDTAISSYFGKLNTNNKWVHRLL